MAEYDDYTDQQMHDLNIQLQYVIGKYIGSVHKEERDAPYAEMMQGMKGLNFEQRVEYIKGLWARVPETYLDALREYKVGTVS